MSSDTEAHVRSLLSQMGNHLSDLTLSREPADRFNGDYNIKTLSTRLVFDQRAAGVVHIYASSRLRKMREALSVRFDLSPQELKTAVSEFLLWNLVDAHAMELPACTPKLHHWLPMCYTKKFASRVMTAKRAAIIQQVTFTPTGEVESTTGVRDTFFAHAKSEDGFYPARMEQFFGRIESTYAMNKVTTRAERSAWSDVALMAFFVVQAARNPDPVTRMVTHPYTAVKSVKPVFPRDHKGRIISEMFATLDAYQTPRVQYARECENLRFSPFFPPRVRVTVSGVTAAVFPLDPCTAMVITDQEISEVEAHRIAMRNAESMVRHAARTGKPLYGVE